MGVVSAEAVHHANRHEGDGAIPIMTLQDLTVRPISFKMAKRIVEREHYLHSMPGGSRIALGVFVGNELLGVMILGAGPSNAHRLVRYAVMDDCAALTRLWLDDDLPKNSESRVLGVVIRHLKRHTGIKFLVTYSDSSAGHVGTIYQATNWLYTGLSQAAAMLDLGDGKPRHSRSVAHAYGTHSRDHFASHGIDVRRVEQSPKHRYVYFLDRSWNSRLNVPALPYPKARQGDGSG
jgi:hypothetical protein